MGDVWHFQSIYELQFFNCPACDYREKSKQKFIDHAINVHPESATYLMNVSDIDDVVCPWNEINGSLYVSISKVLLGVARIYVSNIDQVITLAVDLLSFDPLANAND